MLFLSSIAIVSSINQKPAFAASNQTQTQQQKEEKQEHSSNITKAVGAEHNNNSNKTRGPGVYLRDLRADPMTVKILGTFRLSATVVNNSTKAITFVGGCESPLSATFDKHVRIEHNIGCLAIQHITLDAGKSKEISGPSSGTIYRAQEIGMANGNVTLTYNNGVSENITKPIRIKIS